MDITNENDITITKIKFGYFTCNPKVFNIMHLGYMPQWVIGVPEILMSSLYLLLVGRVANSMWYEAKYHMAKMHSSNDKCIVCYGNV